MCGWIDGWRSLWSGLRGRFVDTEHPSSPRNAVSESGSYQIQIGRLGELCDAYIDNSPSQVREIHFLAGGSGSKVVNAMSDDIQLKFEGAPVDRLDGAPAEAVVASLNALQRMVYIIGMQSEGHSISERLKPPAKVKREYAVVCRAPKRGSHIQPFNVASQSGDLTPASMAAREKLLKTLKAFDSGDEQVVKQVLPNARERWFMARAALGLLPPEDSGIEVTVRAGARGPFTFKAQRARTFLKQYEVGSPPEVGEETVTGKLRAIDFARTIVTIKPAQSPALRLDYPLQFEEWLKANVRRRVRLVGKPKFNPKGDVTSFEKIFRAYELEPTLDPVEEFKSGDCILHSNRPLSLAVSIDWEERVFLLQDAALGIDIYSLNYKELRGCLLGELDMLWRQYALASDEELDSDALAVKQALLSRFRAVQR